MIINHWTAKDIARDLANRQAIIRSGHDSRREFLRKFAGAGLVVGAAGLLLPRSSRAASTIKARTISSVVDNRIALANSNFARPLNVSSWNTLRVGVRLTMNNTAANLTSTPHFYVGLCSGQSNIVLDATTTHWAGLLVLQATWTFVTASGGSMTNYQQAGGIGLNNTPAKRVGSTLTTGSLTAETFMAADPTATIRRMFFVDIVKGSPNYTFKRFYCSGVTASPDVLVSDFLAQMALTSPSFTNHAFNSSGSTLAVSESTDGTFDQVNIAWDRLSPTIELSDVAVAKIA